MIQSSKPCLRSTGVPATHFQICVPSDLLFLCRNRLSRNRRTSVQNRIPIPCWAGKAIPNCRQLYQLHNLHPFGGCFGVRHRDNSHGLQARIRTVYSLAECLTGRVTFFFSDIKHYAVTEQFFSFLSNFILISPLIQFPKLISVTLYKGAETFRTFRILKELFWVQSHSDIFVISVFIYHRDFKLCRLARYNQKTSGTNSVPWRTKLLPYGASR